MEILVCVGSDCRKAGDAHASLWAAMDEAGQVQTVRCQKICSGPVAGVAIDGRLEWFERVRGRKSRQALVRLVRTGGPLPDRLRSRRVPKRAGSLRGTTRPSAG